MSGPQHFRKRPVVVEAIRWDGTNEVEIRDWSKGQFRAVEPDPTVRSILVTAQVFDVLHSTWVGVMTGQWVIRGVKGEFYPIDPEVLAETYEPVAPSGDLARHQAEELG